jgi:hypothetical protein
VLQAETVVLVDDAVDVDPTTVDPPAADVVPPEAPPPPSPSCRALKPPAPFKPSAHPTTAKHTSASVAPCNDSIAPPEKLHAHCGARRFRSNRSPPLRSAWEAFTGGNPATGSGPCDLPHASV